jgi:hypothetical protein
MDMKGRKAIRGSHVRVVPSNSSAPAQ